MLRSRSPTERWMIFRSGHWLIRDLHMVLLPLPGQPRMKIVLVFMIVGELADDN